MKFNKLKIAVSILALGATALTGFSQTSYPVGAYSTLAMPLPVTSLAANTATNWGSAGLSGGWTAVVSFTNVTVAWNVSSNAMVNTTNITSVTNTTFASFNSTSQKDVGVEVDWQGSTNIAILWAQSTLPGRPATLGRTTWSILDSTTAQTNALGYRTACTNFPAAFGAGFGYYYVVGITNLDAVNALTNLSITPAREINSP